mmetsp:Transcript_10558/g.31265  ORF Transcript_10558/g.31265 Transcript_10558/m.31265 type:complete len:366 (-) Transcript_10558:155-1252(-)
MQLALRATFIDVVEPTPASSQRSRSVPTTGSPSSSPPLKNEAEARYVSMLQERAQQHFTQDSLDELPEMTKPFSRYFTPGAASNDSTQCPPSPRAWQVESFDELQEVLKPFSRHFTPGAASDVSPWCSPKHQQSSGEMPAYPRATRATTAESEDTRHFSNASADSMWSQLSSGELAKMPSEPRAKHCFPEAAVVSGDAPVVRGAAAGAWSVGSIGHPGLCKHPCIHFARGVCAEGEGCRFCHVAHGGRRNPHLDKRHRELLARLAFAQRASVSLPILKRQVTKLGLSAHARELLDILELIAREATWDARTQKECASLTSALGALSLRAMMMAISKAPDTPEGLKGAALDAHLERIRLAEGGTRQW